LSPIGWLLLSLVPIGQHLRFSSQMWIAGNMLTTMNVTKWPAMYVHDVACKSAIYYPHHEGALFIAKRFHEEKK
jgi:hypothetical protein